MKNVSIKRDLNKFVVIDETTKLKWANEYFDTEFEAVVFCVQNGLSYNDKLGDAMDKVTPDFNGLDLGGEEELNDTYTLYRYENGYCVVIVETEEWKEVLQVMSDGEKLTFEVLWEQ